MNEALERTRCFNHAGREAAARCPECRRFFCRESVTEHEGRVLCVNCLAESAEADAPERGNPLAAIGLGAQTLISLVVLWMFFFTLGRVVLTLPSQFHDAEVWTEYTAEGEWE